MYLVLTASKDTYVTNRKLPANDAQFANVGNASSLDLFKLRSENKEIKPTAELVIKTIPSPGDTLTITNSNEVEIVYTFINGNSSIANKEISLSVDPTINGITNSTYELINSTNQTFKAIEKANNKIILQQDKKGFTAETKNTSSNTDSVSIQDFHIKEFSKLLIHFDYSEIEKYFNINHSQDFNAKLKLFDISTGQVKPKNYTINVYPLSSSFDEGIGNDIYSFGQKGFANFLTSSINSNLSYNTWNLSGLRSKGGNGSLNIDVITGSSNTLYDNKQKFIIGDEDLSIDITNFVSESLSSQVNNNGLVLEFSDDIDQNSNTYFVKRFASRHVKNKIFSPRLDISFDDSFTKPDNIIYTNTPTRIYLENRQGNFYKNLYFTGSMLLDTTKNQLSASLNYLNYTKNIYATQSVDYLGNQKSGSYYVDFNLDMFDSGLHGYLTGSGELDATIKWHILVDENPELNTLVKDAKIKISTGSNVLETEKFLISDIRFDFNKKGTKDSKMFLVSFIDTIANLDAIKIPYRRKGENLGEIYYSVIDNHSQKEIIPFETAKKGTKMSYEDGDYYFTLHNTSLLKDRVLKFKFYLKDYNNLVIENDKTFRI